MPNLLNNVLARLRESRFPHETMTEVARRLGVNKEYLSRLENGVLQKPGKDRLPVEKIVEVYRCSESLAKILRRLVAMGGGPDDGGEGPEDGYAEAMLESIPPLYHRLDQMLDWVEEDPAQELRWIIGGELPGHVVEDRHAAYLISPHSVIWACAAEDHWFNWGDEDDLRRYDRFLQRLLSEPRRVMICRKDFMLHGNVAIVPGVLTFYRGYTDLSLHFENMNRHVTTATARKARIRVDYGQNFDEWAAEALPPEKAVEYVHWMREKGAELRQVMETLGRCDVAERDGRVVVEPKQPPKKKGKKRPPEDPAGR